MGVKAMRKNKKQSRWVTTNAIKPIPSPLTFSEPLNPLAGPTQNAKPQKAVEIPPEQINPLNIKRREMG